MLFVCRSFSKSGNFGLKDEVRLGFEDDELEALLDQDSCQTHEELVKFLEITQAIISKRLKAAGCIHKQWNWMTYELNLRDV